MKDNIFTDDYIKFLAGLCNNGLVSESYEDDMEEWWEEFANFMCDEYEKEYEKTNGKPPSGEESNAYFRGLYDATWSKDKEHAPKKPSLKTDNPDLPF